MEQIIILVLALLVIAGATVIGPRVGVATPLLLVLVGIGVSFLPFVPAISIEPEWILAGILPPLLYSASVSMPTMDFKREFTAIGGLSVALVVISAVVLGFFFHWVIPDMSLWWGIALGAVVSPTDAVATSIVKRSGVGGRVVAVLEGESLLNDATALVLLRAAIAGAAASVSLWGVVGSFIFSVVVASVIGVIIGRVNLALRARVSDSTVNTVLSFTVPFLASIPAELLGASGLVAAVVAGLVTGHGAARRLSPQHRFSDAQNWRTVELVLEGTIFLIMGLELSGILIEVADEHNGFLSAALIAAGALLITLLIRAAYVAPLIAGLRRRARRGERMKPRIERIQEVLDDPQKLASFRGPGRVEISPAAESDAADSAAPGGEILSLSGRDTGPGPRPGGPRGAARRGGPDPAVSSERLARGRTRLRRALADIDYFLAAPLGWREGTVIVWAGMRGAVTLAAAQTIPENAPHRSLIILIAFLVAASSLLIQGGTLGRVVRRVKPATKDPMLGTEHAEIFAILAEAAERGRADYDTLLAERGLDAGEDPEHSREKGRQLAAIRAQREALLDVRDDGLFDAEVLNSALATLDNDQMSLEARGGPAHA
ncbi:cation:proton antiporter [Mycetocola spongiae]|uniref:cation:proton antiporter n=1 Tax=Mycetocola spongiae TaxID=2859226 RepID=UPI001CF25B3A|nr:sodium:proton antiporter [Mycetocola spongiae]UCR89868.1 cation:proton antiporter [Mycetocola spongiae]